MCFFCSVAQSRRVGMSMVIKSRLCNWHHRVGCGWIHLPRAGGHDTDVPGSLSFGVSDRRRQPADAFHVGITACSNIETKTSARLCGKIQLWVSWSLNVSLKVNWCLKFISSDNIFCPKKWAAVFSVLPTRSLNRHLLKIAAYKISCCNNCSFRCTYGEYFTYSLCFHQGGYLTNEANLMSGFLIHSDNWIGQKQHISGDIWLKGKLQSMFFLAVFDS